MTRPYLKPLDPRALRNRDREAVSLATLDETRIIIDAIREGGRVSLLEYGRKFGDLGPGDRLVYAKEDLESALRLIPAGERELLERTAGRIADFARAQRDAVTDVDIPVPGGRAGWRFQPVDSAGCYAPGGRYPLPSSVLMTTVTARVAGVPRVVAVSPRPADMTLAAAAVGGADVLVAAGGAQAVAALVHGVEGLDACDVVVGPGNRYVTAAKQLLAGRVGIDMLAGPSELVILADGTAEPDEVAADLLAQAEHDPDAVPILVTTDRDLEQAVEAELDLQLEDLPTADIARYALGNGGVVAVANLDEAIAICDSLAPEHLQVMTADPDAVGDRLRNFGALFLGSGTAEVFGDYGAGPNHVLPTGGTARFSSPLSVLDFLVGRSWLKMGRGVQAGSVAQDAVDLARLEGLEGHARAAALRLGF
jgi:phosphoribosyl-ATP pyrophosphohydrolase/phosphoribosyl-AMP cyclohydrolase/histidinol dehydrogenase